MTLKRRNFLKKAGGFAAGLALAPYACATEKEAEVTASNAFGIQLYTLREDFPKDPRGVLAQLASFGYKQIESYEGPQGMFWGMTNKEFKAYMDELGMEIVASHCDIDKDFERKAAEAGEIGMKYLICPWRSMQTLDEYKSATEDFNRKGEICRANGLRFAYHNHAYSFTQLDGVYPQDIFMKDSDTNLVDFEMDIYWVVTANEDPIEWMKKYPNRFKLSHVKDREKNATTHDASCTLGTGSIDYPAILKAARQYGMEHLIVEQEKYDGTTPLQSAKDNADYLSKLVKG